MKNTTNKYLHLQCSSILSYLYLLLFFDLLKILVSGESPPPYHFGNIALDCGSLTDNPDLSGRTWSADINSNFSLLQQDNPSTISEAIQHPKSEDAVPYATARLSRSQFSYSFSVTAGPKFIRLYFYPASYNNNFNGTDASFSVTAGRFTLLSNFSAILHARALRLEAFSKEFCLNVEDDQKLLNITFDPSPGSDAYAFINGIEIVSMPVDLYYNGSEFPFVGQINPYSISRSTALALMYRINVGGAFIPPKNDTGMFRSWLDNDKDYLTVDKSSVLPVNLTIQLRFDRIQNYTAPSSVYQTARSMGMDPAVNLQYNLTWEFQVDSLFTYFVRLHFCEIEPPIVRQGDRRFQIYMDNQEAEPLADIIYWSGGNGFPVYRDYAIMMGARENKKVQNLSLALHALGRDQTRSSDAILNGIEIFKLSNGSDSLAGPNPDISLSSPPTAATSNPTSKRQGKNKGTTIGAIIGGAISGFVLLCFIFFLIFRRRLKVKDPASWLGQLSTSSSKTQRSSTLPADICRRFSLAEIKDATNNFDEIFIIGVGGFGNVYKGLINDGATTVAIKRLNPGSRQGAHEFKTEIEMLSQLRYLHLVSLIGYCHEDNEMILVYDYMARGTLCDHLYKTDNPSLTWTQRLGICIGAARGLQYLHSGAKNTIIHRDVKTTNILLDEKWVAKVSDFGLSKIGPNSMSKQHISTVVKGSFGYLDPEYYRLQQLTEKSDVYSFGVVLCEVISARPPVLRSAGNNASLAEWARQSHRKGKFDDIVDPYLEGKIAPDCLRKFAEVAISCLRDNGVDRPAMSDVVWGLEFALQLQETATKQGEFESEIGIDMEMPLKGSSVDDSSDDLFSSGSGLVIGSRLSGMTLTSSSDEQSFLSNNNSENVMSGTVFSEIMNPKGR